MKLWVLTLIVALSGCASNPGQWREDIGLAPTSGQSQDNTAANMALIAAGAQLMQASGPYTLPQQQPTRPAVMMGFLQGQSVSGNLKYCRYSNGVVTMISSVSLCPMSTQ